MGDQSLPVMPEEDEPRLWLLNTLRALGRVAGEADPNLPEKLDIEDITEMPQFWISIGLLLFVSFSAAFVAGPQKRKEDYDIDYYRKRGLPKWRLEQDAERAEKKAKELGRR